MKKKSKQNFFLKLFASKTRKLPIFEGELTTQEVLVPGDIPILNAIVTNTALGTEYTLVEDRNPCKNISEKLKEELESYQKLKLSLSQMREGLAKLEQKIEKDDLTQDVTKQSIQKTVIDLCKYTATILMKKMYPEFDTMLRNIDEYKIDNTDRQNIIKILQNAYYHPSLQEIAHYEHTGKLLAGKQEEAKTQANQ